MARLAIAGITIGVILGVLVMSLLVGGLSLPAKEEHYKDEPKAKAYVPQYSRMHVTGLRKWF